jgi:hypothetical protein
MSVPNMKNVGAGYDPPKGKGITALKVQNYVGRLYDGLYCKLLY